MRATRLERDRDKSWWSATYMVGPLYVTNIIGVCIPPVNQRSVNVPYSADIDCPFAPSGTLAPKAFCLNSNRTVCQVWNYPEPDTATKTLEDRSLRNETLTRAGESACRQSSVTDTRSSRSCDNGLWKETCFSLFTPESLHAIRRRTTGKTTCL